MANSGEFYSDSKKTIDDHTKATCTKCAWKGERTDLSVKDLDIKDQKLKVGQKVWTVYLDELREYSIEDIKSNNNIKAYNEDANESHNLSLWEIFTNVMEAKAEALKYAEKEYKERLDDLKRAEEEVKRYEAIVKKLQ